MLTVVPIQGSKDAQVSSLSRANVNGFDSEGNCETNLPIGTCVTTTKDKHGKTVIRLENEQIEFSRQEA